MDPDESESDTDTRSFRRFQPPYRDHPTPNPRRNSNESDDDGSVPSLLGDAPEVEPVNAPFVQPSTSTHGQGGRRNGRGNRNVRRGNMNGNVQETIPENGNAHGNGNRNQGQGSGNMNGNNMRAQMKVWNGEGGSTPIKGWDAIASATASLAQRAKTAAAKEYSHFYYGGTHKEEEEVPEVERPLLSSSLRISQGKQSGNNRNGGSNSSVNSDDAYGLQTSATALTAALVHHQNQPLNLSRRPKRRSPQRYLQKNARVLLVLGAACAFYIASDGSGVGSRHRGLRGGNGITESLIGMVTNTTDHNDFHGGMIVANDVPIRNHAQLGENDDHARDELEGTKGIMGTMKDTNEFPAAYPSDGGAPKMKRHNDVNDDDEEFDDDDIYNEGTDIFDAGTASSQAQLTEGGFFQAPIEIEDDEDYHTAGKYNDTPMTDQRMNVLRKKYPGLGLDELDRPPTRPQTAAAAELYMDQTNFEMEQGERDRFEDDEGDHGAMDSFSTRQPLPEDQLHQQQQQQQPPHQPQDLVNPFERLRSMQQKHALEILEAAQQDQQLLQQQQLRGVQQQQLHEAQQELEEQLKQQYREVEDAAARKVDAYDGPPAYVPQQRQQYQQLEPALDNPFLKTPENPFLQQGQPPQQPQQEGYPNLESQFVQMPPSERVAAPEEAFYHPAQQQLQQEQEMVAMPPMPHQPHLQQEQDGQPRLQVDNSYGFD